MVQWPGFLHLQNLESAQKKKDFKTQNDRQIGTNVYDMYPLVYKSDKFGWIIMRGGADGQPFFQNRQTDRRQTDRPKDMAG